MEPGLWCFPRGTGPIDMVGVGGRKPLRDGLKVRSGQLATGVHWQFLTAGVVNAREKSIQHLSDDAGD